MNGFFTIGEFSRTTQLSVKALRHYHDVGLLAPVAVDPTTGYRTYAVAQVPTAQVIRRLRDLDMPIDQVRTVLDAADAGDVAERDRVLLEHLAQMEQQLEQTKASVSSLRALLEGSVPDLDVEYRSIGPTRVVATRAEVGWDDAEAWLADAFATLHAVAHGARVGPDGAVYSPEFFEAHVGEVIAFVPISDDPVDAGTLEVIELPAVELAVAIHCGAFDQLDQTYAALGAHVASRAIGVDGPIREHYVDVGTERDEAQRTEVAWSISNAQLDRK